MEKKELEIRKAPEELTAEDLANVNGGYNVNGDAICDSICDCPKNCPENCLIESK